MFFYNMDKQLISSVDNLATARQRFILKCQKNYSLGFLTTTDEELVGFGGRCRFCM